MTTAKYSQEFEDFWKYWRGLDDLHGGFPGTKMEGWAEAKKLSPEEFKDMAGKTASLVEWDRLQKQQNKKVDRYKHLCRWIKTGAYERYVGSYAKERGKQDKICKCNKPATIQGECQACYFERTKARDWRRQMTQQYYYNNLHVKGESPQERTERLRGLCKAQIKRIGK